MGEGYIKSVSKEELDNIHRVINTQLVGFTFDRPYLAAGQSEGKYAALLSHAVFGQGLLSEREERVLAELARHAGKNNLPLSHLASKTKLRIMLRGLKYKIRA